MFLLHSCHCLKYDKSINAIENPPKSTICARLQVATATNMQNGQVKLKLITKVASNSNASKTSQFEFCCRIRVQIVWALNSAFKLYTLWIPNIVIITYVVELAPIDFLSSPLLSTI